jgi:hypothetical protein
MPRIILFIIFYLTLNVGSFAKTQSFGVLGGLTAINETPADTRLSYGLRYQIELPYSLKTSLTFFSSHEKQIDLPRVDLMNFNIDSILWGLDLSLPALKPFLLNLGTRLGVSRVKYVYDTNLVASEMLTPELQIENVSQQTNSFVWGPFMSIQYFFSNSFSASFDTQVIFYPASQALTSFSTIDLLFSTQYHF